MLSSCATDYTDDAAQLRGVDFNKLVRKVNFNKVIGHPILSPLGPAGAVLFPNKPKPAPARTTSVTSPPLLPPPPPSPPPWGYDQSSPGSYDPSVDASYDPSYGTPLPPPPIPTGLDPLDLWQRLIGYYLQQRPVMQLPDGAAVPATTIGDVAAAAMLIGRELASSRYDGALLAPVRAGWATAERDATWRAQSQPWTAEYPDNAGFWYGSTLAVAQALSALYWRRNASISLLDRVLAVAGDQMDPLELWQDLRHFFLARRTKRTGRNGFAYPTTNVSDVVQVAEIFDTALRRAPVGAYGLATRRQSWQAARARVDQLAAGLDRDAVYPENERFWLDDTKRLALYLSAAHDAMDGFGDILEAQVFQRHGRHP